MRGNLMNWFILQLKGAYSEAPLHNGGPSSSSELSDTQTPCCLTYFLNPKISLVNEGATVALVNRLAFLASATNKPSRPIYVHLFICHGFTPNVLDLLANNLRVMLAGKGAKPNESPWYEHLSTLVECSMGGRARVIVVPHYPSFFPLDKASGILKLDSPNIDCMLSALRMLIVSSAELLPRDVIVKATKEVICQKMLTKEEFAEILLNPDTNLSSCSEDDHCELPIPLLPLVEVTQLLSWLPPMLFVDCFDEAMSALA
eukprot:GILI01028061.1.p1 GENE.GILI01028061.1~~GILI01028061.1.p1  ORF type:complete len:284 (+),score=1.53 GILI01028061.1:76-852(+)